MLTLNNWNHESEINSFSSRRDIHLHTLNPGSLFHRNVINFIKNNFLQSKNDIEIELFSSQENISGLQRTVLGTLKPFSQKALKNIVLLANQYKIKINPISTGYNWGLGSSLPVQAGGFIVDLSQLNKIRDYNAPFGSVVIEPGVTQRQLSDFLTYMQSDFFLDTTGSSADTSIIGNTLEKGIAYNTLRPDCIVNMEVLLANGETIKTGYQNWEKSKVKGLYKYAPGAQLEGLFLQSNFGIVTSMTFQLRPRNECNEFLSFEFNESNLEAVIEAIRHLKTKLPWDSVIHIANKERVHLAFNLNKSNPSNGVDRLFLKALPHITVKCEWIATGSVSGTKVVVKAIKKEIEKSLKHYGRIKWLNDRKMNFLLKLSSWLKAESMKSFVKIAHSLVHLNIGAPTNQSIQCYLKEDHTRAKHPSSQANEAARVDQEGFGFMYCLSMAPLTNRDGNLMLAKIRNICQKYQFKEEVTLNALNKTTLESVVSISYDKSNPAMVKKAKACIRELHQQLIEIGYPPYRMNIEMMDLIQYKKETYSLLKKLKSNFDPNNILSLGRYLS